MAMTESVAVFALAAGVLGIVGTVPYLRDMLRGTTVPHRGSWLIWGLLGVIAVESQRADGAHWSLVPLVAQAAGTCLVFGLSLRWGTGGVTRLDLVLITLAGAGVAGWLAIDDPTVATGCVIAADLIAATMMVPKSWRAPHTETLTTFVLAGFGGATTVASVGSWSVALLVYPAYFTAVNTALAGVLWYRRITLRQTQAPREFVGAGWELSPPGLVPPG